MRQATGSSCLGRRVGHQGVHRAVARFPEPCRAVPIDIGDVTKALHSVPLPPPVTQLLDSSDAWQQLEPHWGSRAVAGAAEALVEQAARLAPSAPALPEAAQLSVAVRDALAPLAPALTSAPPPTGPPPSLPQPPQLNISLPSSLDLHLDLDLPALGSRIGGLGADAIGGAAGATGGGLEALRAGAAGAASQVSSAAGAALAASGGDWGRGLAAAGDSLAAAAAGGVEGLSSGQLQPHWGTVALGRALESLSAALGDRLGAALDGAGPAMAAQLSGAGGGGLALLDPAASAALVGALTELRSVAGLMTLPPGLGAAGSSSLQQLGASAAAVAVGLRGAAETMEQAAAAAAPDAALAALTEALQQAQSHGIGGHSPALLAAVAALTAAAVAASTPPEGYTGPPHPDGADASDRLTREYDPEAVAAYWSRRPLAVAARSAQVAAAAASFGAGLLLDLASGGLAAHERRRAEQLRGIIERLGPAYVKVAQALSTRVDLLTPAYFEQIQRLQDRVPPFPCEQARAEMERAFGRPLSSVFASLSEQPVAAASLGQVYRATLLPELGGGDVAVKVQRPRVLEQVSLDLLIMRRLAVAMKERLQLSSDWAAIIDAWAVRFFHELDYGREAANAAAFAAQMAAAGVEGITVAPVRADLSSDSVLTTAWVEGEKLSESNASDVRQLCSTLLNAYLIQLLDTGFLHADPHPGNLIRTPDGRICVLDFGLMTEVTPEQRLALVEYIAHLSTQDWEALARDLQTLGFIPPHVDTRAAGLVEPLGRVMVQLVAGGGAAKVNIDKVTADLEELGKQYPIQVPPFFALILRAFSVIEGIALRVDPDYSIVGECFPYLATRLLRDDDPRMRALLRDLLYGGKPRLDAARLSRLADGLAAFTTDGLAAGGAAGAAALAPPAPAVAGAAAAAAASGPVLSPAMVSALRSALRPGSYVSELLVEEMAVAVDALSRDALSRLLGRLLGSAPAALALRGVEALGPLRPVLLPLPTPVELLRRLAPAVAVTPEDQEALALVRALLQLSQRLAASGLLAEPPAAGAAAGAPRLGAARAAQLASELGELLPDLAPGLAYGSDLFARALLRRLASRATEAAALARSGGGGGRMGAAAGSAAVAEVVDVVQPAAVAMRMMPLGGGGGAGASRGGGSAGARGGPAGAPRR